MYITLLLISTLVATTLALAIWRRRNAPGAPAFTVLMIALALWSFGNAMGALPATALWGSYWNTLAYVGVVLVPASWLYMSISYTGQGKLLQSRIAWLLMIEPVLVILLRSTNSLHFAFYLPDGSYGPLFWAHMTYSYLAIIVGGAILLEFTQRYPRLYQKQTTALLIAGLAPWVGNAFYIILFRQHGASDFTPIVFALTSPVLAWAIFHLRLMDVLPVPYEGVVEQMMDGVIITDERRRVIALNPASQRIYGIEAGTAIGEPADQVFHSYPVLLDFLCSKKPPERAEMAVRLGGVTRFFELRRSPLADRQAGLMVLVHEITKHRHMQVTLERRAEELAFLHDTLLDLTSTYDLPVLLQTIIERATRLLDADGGSLYLSNSEKKEVRCVVSYNGPRDILGEVLPFSVGAAGIVAESGKSLVIEDYPSWPHRLSYPDQGDLPEALIAAPLVWQGKVTGVINLLMMRNNGTFKQQDLDLLTIFTNQAAIVVENARLLASERQQRRQAEVLREVAISLTANLDREQVMHQILEQLERVIEYDSASVMMVINSHLRIVASRKFRSHLQQFLPLEIGRLEHISEVLESKQPVLIPDISVDDRWFDISGADYIQCWLGVPLIGRDRVLGLLNLDKMEKGYYTLDDAETAGAFAAHAALAIENARLFESAQQRAQEAETLRQASAAVLSTLHRSEAIDQVLVQLERVVPYDSASVQLLMEGYLEIVGGRGWREPDKVMGLRFAIPGMNPNSVVITSRRPYTVSADGDEPLFSEQVHRHIRSWLGVPLIVHEKLVGMLALDSTQPDFYTDQHARLAAAFADQVAIAIENTRLYAAERQRVDESDALRATFADISAELELKKLLEAIIKRATTLLNATGGDLGLYDPASETLEMVASYNMGKDYSGTIMQIGEGAMGHVAETLKPLIVRDYTTWEGRSPQYMEGTYHATVAVPMLIGGRFIGVIGIVDASATREFTQNDQRLLHLFAQQAAIAVDNARLYQAAREAAERRGVLHTVSQEIISASLEPETIFSAIYHAVVQLMPSEGFVIALKNEDRGIIEACYMIDRGERIPSEDIPLGMGLSGKVIESGNAFNIGDVLAEENTIETLEIGDGDSVRSILAVPIRTSGKTVGMLSCQSYEVDAYTSEDQRLLEMLASYAAIALDNARLFKEVQHLAITDPLTRVYNRRHFFENAQRELGRARRFQRSISLLLMDIDHFKKVNDTYGHQFGDITLVSLCRTIEENIREIDFLARYGGEEFVLLLPETGLEAASIVAERLRSTVEKRSLAGHSWEGAPITLSIGVASNDTNDGDIDSILAAADEALYIGKDTGRNRVAVAHCTDASAANRKASHPSSF